MPPIRPRKGGFRHMNVYQAAQKRISFVFDYSEKVILSFSAGKDSSVMLHLAAREARKRKRKFALLIIDLEAQYKATIDHMEHLVAKYADCTELYWIALPLSLRNGVSAFMPQWICWDKDKKDIWVRQPNKLSIIDYNYFPFYHYAMEFEDFVDEFTKWYQTKDGGKKITTSLVGIRTQESLNRWKAIHQHEACAFNNKKYLNIKGKGLINAYPIFDWKIEDIWKANGLNNWEYNRIYDLIYQTGISINEARICQPYGDDQKAGLHLFRKCEPETWGKVVQRVTGANYGNIYCGTYLLGNKKIIIPKNMKWHEFLEFLLNTIPRYQAEWYKIIFNKWFDWWDKNGTEEYLNEWIGNTKNKKVIAEMEKFRNWWIKDERKTKDKLPDECHHSLEARGYAPSYKRMVKCVYKNDILCHSLSYGRVKDLYYRLAELKQKYGE